VGTSTETGSRDEQETTTDAQQAEQFSIRAPAWADGETIPTEYTCNGDNASPALEIESPPEVTQSFALVMDDPDAPNPPFVHWLLWDVPVDVREIPRGIPDGETVEALDGGVHGANGSGDLGYVGPCPPENDPQHTYLFDLYALAEPLGLDPGATSDEVLAAVIPRAEARARFVGQYERAASLRPTE
jgi:Raf kinase inhibitor-like YbhB/YbcL family protein